MDETLSTIRNIYLALVTICLVSSAFFFSPRQSALYEEAANIVQKIIDNRLSRWYYDADTLTTNSLVQSKLKITNYLKIAGLKVRDSLLTSIEVPVHRNISILEEQYALMYWRRYIESENNKHATIFIPTGLDIQPQDIKVATSTSLPTAVFLETSYLTDTLLKAWLVIWYGRDAKGRPSNKSGPVLRLKLNGSLQPIPGTSLREWLRSKKILQLPVFNILENDNTSLRFLPTLDYIWPEIQNKKPAEAVEYLLSEASKHRGKIKLFELEIDESSLANFIPTLMLIIQLILYVHIKHLKRILNLSNFNLAQTFPFIGLFYDVPGRVFYGISLILWPLFVLLTLIFLNSGLNLWFSWLISISAIACGFLTFNISLQLQKSIRLFTHLNADKSTSSL